MAKAFIDDTNLTDIADAIRATLDESRQYLPSEMAAAIQSIPIIAQLNRKKYFQAVPAGAASGYATIEQIEGNTVAWNQLVSNGNFSDFTGWNINNASYTITDNVLTMVSTTSTGRLYRSMGFTSGHKYLLSLKKVSADGIFNFVIFNGDTRVYTSPNMSGTITETYSFIYECANTGTLQVQPVRVQASGVTVSVTNIQIHDLTVIFGSGNEPTTVAEFEARREQNGLPSVADYNAGELLSVKMSGMQTEDSSQQTLDTIALDVTTITGINTATNVRETIFPNGMKWSNNVSDILNIANDTATVNIGTRVFDGTEAWERLGNSYWFSLIKSSFTNLAPTSSAGTYPCSHFNKSITQGGAPSVGACGFGNSYFNVNYDNTTTTPVSTFTNYLATQYTNGTPVTLVYPLATPITYTDLQDSNGNPLNPRYKVEQGGTEQVLPVNTSTPTTVAPTLTTTYTKDNN